MNVDTGELIAFENDAKREEFFKTAQSERFVPVEGEHLTLEELLNNLVENKEIKEVLIEISKSKNLSRGIRRRLEKKLYKLRKKENK